MRRRMLFVLPVVACALLVSAAARAEEFSADMVSRDGNEIMTAKIFVAQDKVRMEMPDSIMIVRQDKGLTWMIMASEQMYMENPIDRTLMSKVSGDLGEETERVPMGSEVIDGQSAEKFKVTTTRNGKTETVYQWMRGQVPVKTEAEDQSWSTEYKNLVVAPQPAELFEPPEGYQKMTMPSMGEMLKGIDNMLP